MIEFCYQGKIDDFFIPNGTPPFIVDKMKKMKNPLKVFENGCFQEDLKLEIGVSTLRHIKALLEHGNVEYRECLISERINKNYLLPIAVFGSANGIVGISNGQIDCEFTKTFTDKVLVDIRNGKCKVLLDNVSEGLPYDKNWCEKIHEVIDSSNLSRSSIYFFTGNNVFKQNYIQDFNDTMNILETQTFFESQTKDYCNNNFLYNEKFKSHKRHKYFLSLNRSPRLHRSKLFDYLKENDLLEYGYVSFVWRDYFVDSELTTSAEDNQAGAFIEREYFEDSYFNIVTETWFYEKSLFLTEKIFKSIIYFQPFLLFGGAHSLKLFRDLGYKTFDKIIDESYDDEENNDKRFNMVISELNRLCKIPIEEIHDMYLSVRDILEHNYNHFLLDKEIGEWRLEL
jgi:hypothetical protein